MEARNLNTLRQTDNDPSRVRSNDGSIRPAEDTGFRVGKKVYLNTTKKLEAPSGTRSWGADGT